MFSHGVHEVWRQRSTFRAVDLRGSDAAAWSTRILGLWTDSSRYVNISFAAGLSGSAIASRTLYSVDLEVLVGLVRMLVGLVVQHIEARVIAPKW